MFQSIRGVLNRFGFDIRRTWFSHLWINQAGEISSASGSDGAEKSKPSKYSSVLVYLNLGSGGEALLNNSIQSAREAGYDGEIWVVGNLSSEETKQQLAVAGMTTFRPLSDWPAGAQSTRFADERFVEITLRKWEVIRESILSTGKTVIFSDNDVVWLQDPDPYIKQASAYFGVGIQSESRDFFPPAYCLGLMYFTPGSVGFLDFLISKSKLNSGRGTAQQLFNEIIQANPQLVYTIWPLPEAVFPVGLSYPLLGGAQHEEAVHSVDIIAFHVNWFPSSDAKRRALQSLGLWRV